MQPHRLKTESDGLRKHFGNALTTEHVSPSVVGGGDAPRTNVEQGALQEGRAVLDKKLKS